MLDASPEVTVGVTQTGGSLPASGPPRSPSPTNVEATASTTRPDPASAGPTPSALSVGFVGTASDVCTIPADLASIRQTLTDLQDSVAVQTRRFEACEKRLVLYSLSRHYWSARCERLEGELGSAAALVVRLREELQCEKDLVGHWRRQVDIHRSEFLLLAEKLRHAGISEEPIGLRDKGLYAWERNRVKGGWQRQCGR